MVIRSARNCAACLLIVAGAFALSAGQQGPPAQAAEDKEKGSTTVTVTVTNRDRHPLAGLTAQDFTLYEDGARQSINAAKSDLNACVGLVVDHSGSMRSKLPAVAPSLIDFVRAGNPDNLWFVVNFNEEPFLDQDFTHDGRRVAQALSLRDAKGGTALYDTVAAAVKYFAKGPSCRKRILVVVSDGEDNESRIKLQQTIEQIQASGGVIVYTIGLADDSALMTISRTRHVLETLAKTTGGASFYVEHIKNLDKVMRRVADEIHGQYTLTYVSTRTDHNESAPKIRVDVSAANQKKVEIRFSGAVLPETNLQATTAPVEATVSSTSGGLQPLGGCIAGMILDNEKKPLAATWVEARPTFTTSAYSNRSFPSVVTNGEGEFRIYGLAPGEYRLYTRNERAGYPLTSSPLYEDRAPRVDSGSEGCAKIDVNLGPKAAKLRVRAVDAGTQVPLANFTVWLHNAEGRNVGFPQRQEIREILVPADSEFTMTVVSPPGYIKSQPITVHTQGPGTLQEITVTLELRASAPDASKLNR